MRCVCLCFFLSFVFPLKEESSSNDVGVAADAGHFRRFLETERGERGAFSVLLSNEFNLIDSLLPRVYPRMCLCRFAVQRDPYMCMSRHVECEKNLSALLFHLCIPDSLQAVYQKMDFLPYRSAAHPMYFLLVPVHMRVDVCGFFL